MKNKRKKDFDKLKINEREKLKILEEIFWKEYRETKEIFNKTKEILNKNN